MSAPSWLPEARQMRDDGATYASIAERFGVGPSKARYWLIDSERRDTGNKEAKQASADRHRAPCPRCGNPMALGSEWRSKQSEVCQNCRRELQAEAKMEMWRKIETLWNEGKTIREIGEAVGRSANHVGVDLDKMRKHGGFHVPLRYKPRATASG